MCGTKKIKCGESQCGPGNEAWLTFLQLHTSVSGLALDFHTPLYLLPLSIICSTLTCSRVKAKKRKKTCPIYYSLAPLYFIFSHSSSHDCSPAVHQPSASLPRTHHSSAHRPPHPHLVILHFCCRVLASAPSSRRSC